LQEFPVVLEFSPVYLRPGFNQTLLRLWKSAAQALDCVDSKHGGLVLVVRMKVRAMMLAAGLDEHPNDNTEEP
jgi:hypothetical protein